MEGKVPGQDFEKHDPKAVNRASGSCSDGYSWTGYSAEVELGSQLGFCASSTSRSFWRTRVFSLLIVLGATPQ